MRGSKWSGVPVTFSVEVERVGGLWEVIDEGKRLPMLDTLVIPGDYGELVLECESSGYHDPGQISGPPERCYPPEGEDYRELRKAYIDHEPIRGLKGRTILADDVGEQLFTLFKDEIYAVELPDSRDMEPDPDDWRND